MTEPADEYPETTPGQAAYLLARAELASRREHRPAEAEEAQQ